MRGNCGNKDTKSFESTYHCYVGGYITFPSILLVSNKYHALVHMRHQVFVVGTCYWTCQLQQLECLECRMNPKRRLEGSETDQPEIPVFLEENSQYDW